ncbi:hypothetical protein OKA04_12400 [Luteolibacter flavescens]|uniref:Uncharacterized protein n=1 Tax=Luteolibacter flavescens TaxID=1859460 RepID=A0ABT3FQ08_9BACT|nr:hypothetical protein [Luteolibacter flavescens]MCW1885532.1 hypothetical protein [Luteolibacter flavescens]
MDTDEGSPTPISGWQLGPSGVGSLGVFHRIRHVSGFEVTHFPDGGGHVSCSRPEPCPEWHRDVMNHLKSGVPYPNDGPRNVCGDILGFLNWVEDHQPST